MVVCVAGKNDIAVLALDYLLKNCKGRYELIVVCNKDETGFDSWQRSLRFFAKENHIPECRLEEIYDQNELVFLSAEYDRIIKTDCFKDARLYNIHFSLLPKYKGMYTSAIPILNGEKYVGVTLHKIDRGIDTGDIIAQTEFELEECDTCRDLYLKYIRYGTELVLSQMENILAGKVEAYPQPVEGSTYYSKEYIDYSDIKIDLNQTADNINRQIRAFTFREYQMPAVYGRDIIAAKSTFIKSDKKPGTILSEDEHGMMLSTIDYNIYLYFDRLEELLDACEHGEMGKVKEICEVKAHINQVSIDGRMPISVAASRNHVEIVNYLILTKDGGKQ